MKIKTEIRRKRDKFKPMRSSLKPPAPPVGVDLISVPGHKASHRLIEPEAYRRIVSGELPERLGRAKSDSPSHPIENSKLCLSE
jgi:hypothetical protein